jgi:hypothetical protein
MAVTELMRTSAERMERAEAKLKEAREAPFTPSGLHAWLSALTDYALALGEVQEYSQESIHEKLQALGREVRRPDLIGPRRAS